MFQDLSMETRTLHAELMERLAVREAGRNIGNLEGSFSTKTIAGRGGPWKKQAESGRQAMERKFGKVVF
jgi:hypothetical protein